MSSIRLLSAALLMTVSPLSIAIASTNDHPAGGGGLAARLQAPGHSCEVKDAPSASELGAIFTTEGKANGNACSNERADTANKAVAVAQNTSGVGPGAGSAATPATKIETITVTAERREERLDKVPLSVAVLGGKDLDASELEGTSEALRQVAGVYERPVTQGGGTEIVIRGAAPSAQLASGGSTAGFYLDSIPFGFSRNSAVPDLNSYDLDRVEVLRGPQGVLYGAAALNGVVRVLTNDPDLGQFQFKARESNSITDGGDPSYRGDMALNIPLIPGKLAVRAVVGYQEIGGWIDKVDPTTNEVVEKNINGGHDSSVRFKINAQPTENLSIIFSEWLSNDHYNSRDLANSAEQTIVPNDEPITTSFNAQDLKALYVFPWFTFTSSTSYIDFKTFGTQTVAAHPLLTLIRANTFSEEVNLNSTNDSEWRWSAGGIYRHTNEPLFQSLPVLLPGPLSQEDLGKSYAIFGQLTRTFLNDEFEISAGLRYFQDQVHFDSQVGLFSAGSPPIDRLSNYGALTPRVVLTWHPEDDLTVYASYSQGFRSGYDQNEITQIVDPTLGPVKPDRLSNYEIGSKGSLLDGLVTFDTSLYYIYWSNIQQNVSVFLPGTTVGIAAGQNAGSASGFGVDAAFTVHPLEGWDIGATLGWNGLGIDHTVTSGGLVYFEPGQRLGESPEYTVGGTTSYTFDIGSDGTAGALSASGNFISKALAIQGGATGPTIFNSDALFTLNASFALNFPSNWSVMLYGDNLTNENGKVDPLGAEVPNEVPRLRPRTVGLQIDYRFQ